MLPLEKVSAPRSFPIPPELRTLGVAAEDPQAGSETVPGRTAVDVAISRLRFRNFVYPEAAGPFQALDQLWTLCCRWLQPETCSKEQMLEQLVLEQFLNVLPNHIRPWVVAQRPESCRKAAFLVDNLTKSLGEPAHANPGPAMLPEQGPFKEQMGELRADGGAAEPKELTGPALQLQRLKFAEPPLCQEEWGHLDPAVENLKTYRKVLLWGYQLAQPDIACRQETKELQLVGREPKEGDCSGGRLCQENKNGSMRETMMESLTREILSCPMAGTAPEKDAPLQKVLDSQKQEASSVSIMQRQSVIQQPGQARATTSQSLPLPMVSDSRPPSLGRKRPYPKDGTGQAPESGSGMSNHQQCHGEEEAAVRCPTASETGASPEKPYACECGMAFAWISQFSDHLMSHSGRKLHACQECWKTFNFSLALAEHKKTHEKEKGYVLGQALSSYPATCGALAGGRLSMFPQCVEGDVFPMPFKT